MTLEDLNTDLIIGQMVVDYAVATLHGKTHVFRLAKEIFSGSIPPLRVGFSSFVNSRHLQTFRSLYAKHFPLCSMQLSGGNTVQILRRMERGDLDCAFFVFRLPDRSGWSSLSQARRWLHACVTMIRLQKKLKSACRNSRRGSRFCAIQMDILRRMRGCWRCLRRRTLTCMSPALRQHRMT
jgi:hypothetical protein